MWPRAGATGVNAPGYNGDATGEAVGADEAETAGVGALDEDPVGVGKANVGETAGVGDSFGEGVAVGEPEGVGVGLTTGDGVGAGVGVGIKFAQRCSGTLAPPISWTNFSQRARIFSKSGGPIGVSAVPGKIR